jgi:hypothetical protein
MIKMNDIHYIAGFLDGEATFVFSSGGSPRIQVTSTDLDLIENCKAKMGLDNNLYMVTKYAENHKQAYGFSVNGRDAIMWMMTLYPLLCIRRKEKIKDIIRQWKNMSYNNYAEYCKLGHPLTGTNVIYSTTSGRRCRRCKSIYDKRNGRMRRLAARLV